MDDLRRRLKRQASIVKGLIDAIPPTSEDYEITRLVDHLHIVFEDVDRLLAQAQDRMSPQYSGMTDEEIFQHKNGERPKLPDDVEMM